MNRGTCSSCGAPVLWVVSRAGELLPLDPDVDPAGEVVVVKSRAGGEYGLVSPLRSVDGGQLALDVPADSGRARYRSHWSTCPHAEQHRDALFAVTVQAGADPWGDAA